MKLIFKISKFLFLSLKLPGRLTIAHQIDPPPQRKIVTPENMEKYSLYCLIFRGCSCVRKWRVLGHLIWKLRKILWSQWSQISDEWTITFGFCSEFLDRKHYCQAPGPGQVQVQVRSGSGPGHALVKVHVKVHVKVQVSCKIKIEFS